jgi:hypothetical protein
MIKIITELPRQKYSKWGFPYKPRKPTVSIFQWPNETYSLFVKKPTKNWGRYMEGMLIGNCWDLQEAKKAAKLWLINNQ